MRLAFHPVQQLDILFFRTKFVRHVNDGIQYPYTLVKPFPIIIPVLVVLQSQKRVGTPMIERTQYITRVIRSVREYPLHEFLRVIIHHVQPRVIHGKPATEAHRFLSTGSKVRRLHKTFTSKQLVQILRRGCISLILRIFFQKITARAKTKGKHPEYIN